MKLFLTVLLAVAFIDNLTYAQTVQWTGGTFDWPCAATKSIFKNTGKFISKNIIAIKGAIYKDDAFLALPRLKHGVPATLAKISLKAKGCQASLTPFPCWTLQEEGVCNALQNVVDIFLDPNDILWVLDTGIVNVIDEPTRRCPPKVVAINVRTGKVVKTIDLSGLSTSASRLQYVVSDISRQNGQVFVYVSDAATRTILVYNVNNGMGYRVLLPNAVTSGAKRRDVLYLALLRRQDASTCLLFTYLSGRRLFSIKTEYLQSGSPIGKVHDIGTKPKSMVILGTDNGSALFFRYESDSDIYRWDIQDCYTPSNFQKVYQGDDCNLATDVIPDYKRGRMRVLESSFPDFFQGTVGCGVQHSLTVM